jgi:hypothetical protein
LTAFTQVCENSINAIFVDQAQSGAGNAQAHPTVFALYPETAILQVRQEPALGFVVGVGNIVSDHWAFARYVADACHVDTPILFQQLVPDQLGDGGFKKETNLQNLRRSSLTSPEGWR